MATLTESFDKADSDTLGPDQTWAEDFGDFDIVSNRCRMVSQGVARVTTNLNTQEHYVKAHIISDIDSDAVHGIIARKVNSATQDYYLFDVDYSSNIARLFRTVGGGFTSIASDVGTTVNGATSYLLELRCQGSSITTFFDTVAKHSTTDTGIVNNLQCGIRSDPTTSGAILEWIDWEAGDIVLPPGPTTAPSLNCWMGGWW